MGEKPMGAPGEGDTDPESAAAGINTTRSNIKNAGVADEPTGAGSGGGAPTPDAPDPAEGSIVTTRSNIKGSAGATSDTDPIPGVDVKLGK